jgi:uncharacterized membrane protein
MYQRGYYDGGETSLLILMDLHFFSPLSTRKKRQFFYILSIFVCICVLVCMYLRTRVCVCVHSMHFVENSASNIGLPSRTLFLFSVQHWITEQKSVSVQRSASNIGLQSRTLFLFSVQRPTLDYEQNSISVQRPTLDCRAELL